MPEPIFHIAEPESWPAEAAAGRYTRSTRGATLAEVGFIHCSFRSQVERVAALVYSDRTEPLLLLEIDPARVDAPIRVEAPPGASDEFPHVYGPLPVAAVVAVHDLVRAGEGWRVADAG
jgi:uncharacterized protein (DUF952 family)